MIFFIITKVVFITSFDSIIEPFHAYYWHDFMQFGTFFASLLSVISKLVATYLIPRY